MKARTRVGKWLPLQTLAAILVLLVGTAEVRAGIINTVVGGPEFALANLIIEGIDLGINAGNAGAGVILNRPWVFMFADGTPAAQDFSSAVGAPLGIATNTAKSNGFFGSASSSATANGATGFLTASMSTRGIASANALAGIGSTGISAVPFGTALAMHITTIVIDPLSAPDNPVSQDAPPDPDTFIPFDPSFVPGNAMIDAYLLNELNESYSVFHLEASLVFDPSSGTFDGLDLLVTGPGGVPSSAVTESDFSFFVGPGGFGYRLDDIDITIPYDLPSGWEDLTFSAVLEIEEGAASSVATGACCDNSGQCTDSVLSSECSQPDDTFYVEQTCQDIEPCPGSFCGNDICEPDENHCNCPSDCSGSCCGNGSCESGENHCNCPSDCSGSCCGNGSCESGENRCNCPSDCSGSCCGNDDCEPGESPCSCPQDCGTCDDGDGDEEVPTVSEWSLVIMTVLAFTAGTILFGRRRRRAPV